MLLLPKLNQFGYTFREVLDINLEDEQIIDLYAYFHEEILKEIVKTKIFYQEVREQHTLTSACVLRVYLNMENIFADRTKAEQFYLLHNALNAYTPTEFREYTSNLLYYPACLQRILYLFGTMRDLNDIPLKFSGIIQQFNKLFSYLTDDKS